MEAPGGDRPSGEAASWLSTLAGIDARFKPPPLQIMEALGGDLRWGDRFLAEHAAVFYYWVLVAIYLISPPASYQFMEMVEVGAVLWSKQWVLRSNPLCGSVPPTVRR